MVFRRCYVSLFCILACVLMCKADDAALLNTSQVNSSGPAVSIALPQSSKVSNETTKTSTKSVSSNTDDPIIPSFAPSTIAPHSDPTTVTPSSTQVPTSPTTKASTTNPHPSTTSVAPPTTSTHKPSPSPTTVKPTASPSTVNPHNGSVTTEMPDSHHNRQFDGPSFIGGIVLATGLMAIGFVAFKFYRARTERNYHTL